MIITNRKAAWLALSLSLLLSIMAHGHAQAQGGLANNCYFRNISKMTKQSQTDIKAILQDSQGFMWFGTRVKLNRYDGYTMRAFDCYDPAAKKRDNNISSLFEDSRRQMWVGTDIGVFVYNQSTEKFKYLSQTTAKGVGMTNWVQGFQEDRDHNIWIVLPNQGLFRYHKGQRLKLYKFGTAKQPDHGTAQCLLIDKSGRLWVGTNGNGVFLYDKTADRFIQYLGNHDGNSLTGENIYCMADYGDYLAIGVHEGKLRKLHKKNNVVSDINAPDVFYKIIRDLKYYDDKLWVGTQSGIYIVDEKAGTTRHIHNDPMCSFSLSDNQIGRIYRDRENGIWVGTSLGGINYMPRQGMQFNLFVPTSDPLTISSKRVREMVEAPDDRIWVGTDDGGVNIFNPATAQFQQLGHGLGGRLSSEKTLALMPYGQEMWIGYFKFGLDIVGLSTLAPLHLSAQQLGLNEPSIYSLCTDSRRRIWIGNAWGVYVINDRKTMKPVHMPQFGLNFIYDIIEDGSHNIWVATMGNGVYKYDTHSGAIVHYQHSEGNQRSLSSNSVSSITETSDGAIWFATDRGGICRYNSETNDFSTFSLAQGLPDDNAYKILEDKNGYLWFGTNNGLVKFNPQDHKCTVFTVDNGLPSNQFNYKSALAASNGTFYFGTNEGLISFDPASNLRNQVVPPVYVITLYINNVPVSVGTEDSPLGQSLSLSKEITLEHDQNNIQLDFSALSYVMPEGNYYTWKMDGVDDDWVQASAKHSASYSNLAPGTYYFHIKGSNNDKVWNNQVTTLKIKILPPWWLTIWAYIFYAIVLIGIAAYTWRWLVRRQARKTAEKQRLFESEKEKEMYRSKIDFFTNVAHDIRTPVTLINGPLESLLEMDIADPEIKENLRLMSHNTQDLMSLINQLLDFRKMEAGKMELDIKAIDMTRLLQEFMANFSHTFKADKRKATLHVPSHNIYVKADHSALVKILNNLISNAVRYSASEIEISLAQEQNSVQVTLKNDGDTIPAEAQEKIFTPFFQMKRDANKPSTSGIGLYVSRSLAQMLQGSLDYEVGADGLNTFTLTLPGAVAAEHTDQAMPNDNDIMVEDEADASLATAGTNVSATILLVEDNVQMLHFIADKLRHYYAVETAENGKIALDVLSQKNIDLVISDIMMPEIDGLELCRRIKTDIETSHIPVVLLTAKNDLDSKVQGLRTGADAYIEKPFSFKYLLAQLNSIFVNRMRERDSFNRKPFVAATNITGMTKADEQLLEKIVHVIESNFDNPNFGVELLAEEVCMSRSSLHRKIKAISGTSPTDFIRLIRLKKATQLISEGNYRVGEVCYLVGINSPSYFIKLFQKQFGMTPKEFERRQRQAAKQQEAGGGQPES